jgi:NADPH:quinone reductase-like Zn-dependent oxidoreductase
MKAIVQDKFGSADVLQLRDIDKPVAKGDEVLVRVHAAALNAADGFMMNGVPYLMRPAFGGLCKPGNTVRGMDISGTVEAVGPNVTAFRVGDEVYGETNGGGGFAEYACVAQKLLAPKPANLSFVEAAAVPLAANTALQGLRDSGQVKPGQKVLINGASGGVGTFAVQIAKSYGAEVTGVCSTRNVELIRSLGVDHVIDYKQADFTQKGQRYDLIFDLAGNHSLSAFRRSLTPEGTLVMSSGSGGRWIGPIGRILHALVMSFFVRHKLRVLAATSSKENLIVLKDLIEAGEVKPVIDKTYPLSETPMAVRYFADEHARAKVVITV